jgi:hypothetical protein
MAAEVAANCVAGDVGPRSDECGCSLLVGHRAARNCILGTHLADERHGQGSDPVAGACKLQSNSMGDVCGDHPLRAVLDLCAELESARPRKGACRKSALVGTHLSNNAQIPPYFVFVSGWYCFSTRKGWTQCRTDRTGIGPK